MAQRWQQASLAARIAVGCAALVSVCSGCVIIFALGFAAGLNSPRTASSRAANTAAPQGTHAPTATAKAKAWVTVKHLAGSGNSQSDTFEVRTGDHILTSCTASDSANLFIADLYRQGESYGNNVAYAELVDRANQPCSHDTYTVQQDGATVYLRVQADSVQWTVDVQRFQ